TTYVKPFMIKVVMGIIMVIVLFSRGLMVPVYLSQMGLIQTLGESTVHLLRTTSFAIMIFALVLGAFIVLRAMWQGRRAEQRELQGAVAHSKA
ncbi:MAG: sulfite exporter TauE/SafE family protein, partial [Nitrospirota bacterium]|nr:sulfite exporter TauE/SafE family protein [Nitrospirota bacterium]